MYQLLEGLKEIGLEEFIPSEEEIEEHLSEYKNYFLRETNAKTNSKEKISMRNYSLNDDKSSKTIIKEVNTSNEKRPLKIKNIIRTVTLLALVIIGGSIIMNTTDEIPVNIESNITDVANATDEIPENTTTDTDAQDTVENTIEPEETRIYDKVQIKPVLNGLHTERIGEYSVIRMVSHDVTTEVLEDWYFNHVEPNDYNWCMILYAETDDLMGVYAIDGLVQKDVMFEDDGYNGYGVCDASNSISYYPSGNTLTEME